MLSHHNNPAKEEKNVAVNPKLTAFTHPSPLQMYHDSVTQNQQQERLVF